MTPSSIYTERRSILAKQLRSDCLVFVSATREQFRNGDATFRFRQSSDFYYLTGFNEPEAMLLIMGGSGESILFNLPPCPEQEQWTGKRLGQTAAPDVLGVQAAYPIETLHEKLPLLCRDKRCIYFAIGHDSQAETAALHAMTHLKRMAKRELPRPIELSDLEPLLSEMRLFKTPDEIHLMQKAADISVLAHQRAMQAAPRCRYEYQLEAELIYTFIQEGCRGVAYEPIVAAGKNACILHYGQNQDQIPKDSLILIDAAGEYENYAADITRTFPAQGRFSPAQKDLYELILLAQQTAIEAVKPGCIWSDLQDKIARVLTPGLCDLKLLKGSINHLLETQAYKRFYMHGSGHWLGLDVHDSGHYKKNGTFRPLEANMVLTVEPGLYIPEADDVDSRWWNMGIRIEDDILVTETGYRNLTQALPSKVDDVEALICG